VERGIDPPTWSMLQHVPHFSILNQEKIGVKFNKCFIIKSKPMNGDKVFVGGWDM
jgi:hypothetical protein